jgi:hypothetical protein
MTGPIPIFTSPARGPRRPALAHGLRQHVGEGVALERQHVGGVALGDDRDLRAVGERREQVGERAVDARADRGAREAGADGGGGVGGGRAGRDLQALAVG